MVFKASKTTKAVIFSLSALFVYGASEALIGHALLLWHSWHSNTDLQLHILKYKRTLSKPTTKASP